MPGFYMKRNTKIKQFKQCKSDPVLQRATIQSHLGITTTSN